jgi:PBSX family phage terminase large subunit
MHYDKIIYVNFPIIANDIRGFLPKQLTFIDLCNKEDAVLYSGAFRAGKTMLLVHNTIIVCLENPNIKGLLGSLTETQLDTVVFSLFLEQLDKYQKEIDKAGIDLKLAKRILRSQGKKMVEFYNGSIVYFRSCDDERKLASYTLDFFGLDEPVDMDESIFTQLLGRISGTGNLENPFGMLTTNPENETHWIYKYFYIMKEKGFVHIDTTTYDNKLLPKYDEYIKRLENTWDADWIRRYLNGTWGAFSGAIYKEFNPEKHVGDFKDLPVKYKIASVDWGLRDPHAVLIAGVTTDNRLVILEEHYKKNVSTHDLSKKLAELHKKHKFRKVYCDPSAADLILQSYNRGVPIGKRTNSGIKSFADNDIKSGIARMQSLFKNNSILIDKRCVNFIREHKNYRYSEGTDKPIPKDDHTCDSARYLTTDFNPYKNDNTLEVIYWNLKNKKWL